MSDFNQDMQNLLNAYDSNWEVYLILREQFIEKYSLSVDKLQEENRKLRNVIARLSNQTQVDYRGAYEESQEQLSTAKKALREIAEFDCCDDCYSTAYEALMEIDEEFQKNISKVNKFIEEAKKRLKK